MEIGIRLTSCTHMPNPVSRPLSNFPPLPTFLASLSTILALMTPATRYGLSLDEVSPLTRFLSVVYSCTLECFSSTSAPSSSGSSNCNNFFRDLVCKKRSSNYISWIKAELTSRALSIPSGHDVFICSASSHLNPSIYSGISDSENSFPRVGC